MNTDNEQNQSKIENQLQNKTALVTGSGRGIGRAIALEFARRGASVVINYAHSADEADAVGREIEQMGRKFAVIKADLSVAAEIDKLVGTALEKFGGIDILVNNAGIEKKAPFWEVSEADFDQVVKVDLKGVFFTTQAVVRNWISKKKTGGRIINISSVHEQLPFPGYASYCVAKGGVGMLTKTLAVELGPYGINVNGIAPGAIATEINETLLADTARVDRLNRQIPLRRMGTPEEVAKLAAFLAGPDAGYVNGSTYFVDGGLMWNYEE